MSKKVMVSMLPEQLDEIVTNELQEALEYQMTQVFPAMDFDLCESLRIVLQYYMPERDYYEYIRKLEKAKTKKAAK